MVKAIAPNGSGLHQDRNEFEGWDCRLKEQCDNRTPLSPRETFRSAIALDPASWTLALFSIEKTGLIDIRALIWRQDGHRILGR
jgi:hypothetical protein